MNCHHCYSPSVVNDHYATGDWNITYECGTSHDDNGNHYQSEKCKELEAALKLCHYCQGTGKDLQEMKLNRRIGKHVMVPPHCKKCWGKGKRRESSSCNE